MPNYTALINAWSTTPSPPSGVTGVGITSTQTTAAKLVNINGWTITGVVPTAITVSGASVANCIVFSEFNALTAAQQSNLLSLCAQPGGLLGGSTNVGLLTAGMVLAYFGSSSVTIANLTALAKSAATPWWQASTANSGGGLSSPVSGSDLVAAGNLT